MKISNQNADILHLNTAIAPNTRSGIKHTIANALKPAVINWYIANKNKRKSNNTLPPFSREYVEMLVVIYFAWLFSIAVNPI